MAKQDKSLILLNNSLERISRKKDYFNNFDNIEEWFFGEADDILENEIKYLEYIKNSIVTNYWKKDIFISSAALDDIIFYAIKTFDLPDIINGIDDLVNRSYLNRNSVVIFPLHSFGFKYGGLGKILGNPNISYKTADFQIFPQSNSYKNSKNNVLAYIEDIKLPNRRKLDVDLFRYYYQSRGLKWFERNPIMLLHFKFSQQERYDNLRFIIQKINFITNKLYILSALGNIDDETGSSFSTRKTNNWETLDIKHFLTITTSKGNSTLNCVPVHFSNFMIYEKMHMNIDLLLKRKSIKHWEKQAIACIDNFYKGYLNYTLTENRIYAIYYRISSSLDYFRRSIKSISKEDKVININIAFESLLLDRQEGDKKNKMLDRLWKGLKGKINKKYNLKNIEEAIKERNEIIHNGQPAKQDLDFVDIFKTYCRFILFIHDNINMIDSTKDNYLTTFYNRIS